MVGEATQSKRFALSEEPAQNPIEVSDMTGKKKKADNSLFSGLTLCT